MSPHLLIVAQKASVFKMAIEQQSKIEGGYIPTGDTMNYRYLTRNHESGVELLYVAPKDHVAPNI
jgi:hypothetical protein